MKIQIYTMQTPEEALAVAASGVDHIGITPSNRGLPGEVDVEIARGIVDAVGGLAVAVALTVKPILPKSWQWLRLFDRTFCTFALWQARCHRRKWLSCGGGYLGSRSCKQFLSLAPRR